MWGNYNKKLGKTEKKLNHYLTNLQSIYKSESCFMKNYIYFEKTEKTYAFETAFFNFYYKATL
jgi:hypothetical protein